METKTNEKIEKKLKILAAGDLHGDKKLIALLPIGGRFTMDFEEAFEVVKLLKPFITIPMHYGSIVGSEEDAREFCEMCKEINLNCELLGKG